MKSMNFVCGSAGAVIFMLLVVGSNGAAAAITGTALEGIKCVYYDPVGTATPDAGEVCHPALTCYITPPTLPPGPGGPVVAPEEVTSVAGKTEGKCHCEKAGDTLAAGASACAPGGTGSGVGTIAHGAECTKHDACKPYLGCFKAPAKKGDANYPDEEATTANKLTASSASTAKGTCLCESDKSRFFDSTGNECKDFVRHNHGESCDKMGSYGCLGDTTCQAGGEPGGPDKPDKQGTGLSPGGTGICVCGDSSTLLHEGGNKCKKYIPATTIKGHGDPCGATDKCDDKKKLKCRVGGELGAEGDPDKQGTKEWVAGESDGKCLCPDKEGLKKDKSGCETKSRDTTDPNPNVEGTGAGTGSGSDRIVYHLMSSVAAMGSLLFL